jgi:hypothetical protein
MIQKLWFSLLLLSLLACGHSATASRVSRTPLPTLTPTVVFPRWEAEHVIRAILRAGLECEAIQTMTPEEYGDLPVLEAQGVRFSTPSICPHCGGIVLSFDQKEALEAAKQYYLQASPEPNSETSAWVFVKDNILFHLSPEIPRSQALQYGGAFVKLK